MKKSKKKVISIITGTSIIAATFSVGAKIVNDGYVCTIYGLERNNMVDDFDADGLKNMAEEDNLLSYARYPAFSSRIVDEVSAPSKGDMTPQGITVMNNFILVSSYDHSKNDNSIINVYEKNGTMINSCKLDIKSHVGSIAYDKQNGLIWVPSYNGNINAYRANDVLTKDNVLAIYSNLNIGDGLLDYQNPLKNSIAYLTIKDDALYVGSFSLVSHGLVKKYTIEMLEDKVKLAYKSDFKVPTRVQGIEFYNKDDKDYMILSRSFGQSNSSLLQIFLYDEENKNYHDGSVTSVSYEAPSMMEQIVIDSGNLYALFESGAMAYSSCKYKINDICVLEADKLISKCK